MATSTMMKKLSMATVGAALMALGTTGAAQAAVLTFDDVSNTSSFDSIYNGYGGFNWNNFLVENGTSLPVTGTGYDNGRVSGDYTAFNGFGQLAILSNSVFDFNGTYLTGAWHDGLSIVVEGLKNGSSLYSKTVVVDTTGPTWFDFNFLGIDQLKFTSFGGVNPGFSGGDGTQFAMDNFTFNETKSVPEPTTTLGLLALGALGAGSMLKRKPQEKVTAKA